MTRRGATIARATRTSARMRVKAKLANISILPGTRKPAGPEPVRAQFRASFMTSVYHMFSYKSRPVRRRRGEETMAGGVGRRRRPA
jgi:hypothetical protein